MTSTASLRLITRPDYHQEPPSQLSFLYATYGNAVALDIGSSEWQRQRIADAYDVARTIGTNFKFFISFEFTEMGCDLNDIVSRTRTFSDHPSQFKTRYDMSEYYITAFKSGSYPAITVSPSPTIACLRF
jgi:hypothetical protein